MPLSGTTTLFDCDEEHIHACLYSIHNGQLLVDQLQQQQNGAKNCFICWDVLLSPLGSDSYIAQSSRIKTAVGKRTLGQGISGKSFGQMRTDSLDFENERVPVRRFREERFAACIIAQHRWDELGR